MARTSRARAGSVLALVLLSAGSAEAHPSLFFSPAEEVALAAKVQQGVPGNAYSSMCSYIWTTSWPNDSAGKCVEEIAFRYRMTGEAWWADYYVVPTLTVMTSLDPAAFYDPAQIHYFATLPVPIAVAYDLVYDLLEPTTRQQVVHNLEQYGELLYGYVDGGDRPLISEGDMAAYGSLGLLSLAILHDSSHGAVPVWLAKAADRIGADGAMDSWNPGGSHDGGFTGSLWGSPEALRFCEAYRRETGVDLLAGSNLEQASKWYTYSWLPHLRHPSWGLSPSYLYGPAFTGEHLLAISRSDDRLGKWGWQLIHGSWGIDGLYRPAPTSDLLPVALWYPDNLADISDPAEAGYGLDRLFHDTASSTTGHIGSEPGQGGTAIFRDGWTHDSVALAFRVRDEWHPNSHNDSSSFILSAYGAEMVLDPPTAEYPDRDDHNVVVVSDHNDGAAERLSFQGAFHEVFSSAVGYAAADGRYPSGAFDPGEPADLTDDEHTPVGRADRAVALVRGQHPYVIVADDVSADGTSYAPYNWMMQLGTSSYLPVTNSGAPDDPFQIEFYGGQQLLVTVVAPGEGTYLGEVEWHPDYQAHRRLVVTASGQQARFLMVLQPRRHGGDPEQPVIRRLAVSGGVGAELEWYDTVDQVLFRHAEAVSTDDGGFTDGRLAIIRTFFSYPDDPLMWFAAEATTLFSAERGLLDMGGLRGSASLDYSQLYVKVIEDPAPRQIAAYGPWISEVILNGVSVPFDRAGDYVLLPTECAAEERCNGVDDDCDGEVDEDDASDAPSWYLDDDDDGYGDPDSPTLEACRQPEGYVDNDGDCDDDDNDVNPGEVEDCGDAEDDDCNGLIDELDPTCVETELLQQDNTMCTCRTTGPSSDVTPWWLLAAVAGLLRRIRRGPATVSGTRPCRSSRCPQRRPG